jgi:DNA-binding HxlR family transcriptional regulator
MSPRSYGQFCGLARALDTIGERWSLLIVRELLIEPRRYAELQRGLPGIASNLLAERLRAMESAGVIERALGAPGEGTFYRLTRWGEALREPVDALIRWSAPLMAAGRGADSFAPHWLALALEALLHDRRADPPRQLTVNVDGTLLSVQVGRDGVHVTTTSTDPADTIRAAPELLLAIAARIPPEHLSPTGSMTKRAVGRLVSVLG